MGEAVFSKARVIRRLGNDAVHSSRPVRQFDAVTAVRELFHIGCRLARHYARGAKPRHRVMGRGYGSSKVPTAFIPPALSSKTSVLTGKAVARYASRIIGAYSW